MTPGIATRTLALLATLTAIAGCNQPSFTEYMSEGAMEYDSGNYSEAAAMFRSASEIDPQRPEPSYQIGRCWLALAEREFTQNDLPGALRYCDRAVGAFDKSIAAFPGYSKAVQGQADALKLKDKHEAAYEIAQWVAAQSGYRAKKLILKARQYYSSGDMDSAQLALKKATAVEPDSAVAHAELGLFYMRLNNVPEATKSLKRAYELNPGAPGVLTALIELGETPAFPSETTARQ